MLSVHQASKPLLINASCIGGASIVPPPVAGHRYPSACLPHPHLPAWLPAAHGVRSRGARVLVFTARLSEGWQSGSVEWRQLLSADDGYELRPGAAPDEIAAVEAALAAVFPAQLREVYQASNG